LSQLVPFQAPFTGTVSAPSDSYKLIRYPQVDVTQLFDLETDPDEMHDLSKEPAHADRIARMTAQLAKAQAHYTDTQPLTVANPKPSAWKPPLGP
jgi:arylsulfatase A-like enzyme